MVSDQGRGGGQARGRRAGQGPPTSRSLPRKCKSAETQATRMSRREGTAGLQTGTAARSAARGVYQAVVRMMLNAGVPTERRTSPELGVLRCRRPEASETPEACMGLAPAVRAISLRSVRQLAGTSRTPGARSQRRPPARREFRGRASTRNSRSPRTRVSGCRLNYDRRAENLYGERRSAVAPPAPEVGWDPRFSLHTDGGSGTRRHERPDWRERSREEQPDRVFQA